MFEITDGDIAALNDADLRELVGLLCEAEIRRRSLPLSAISYGGHQDAKDGGIDVRVSLSANVEMDGFIPRANTGFQVKKPDMTRSAIIAEMKPGGILRQSIVELANNGGAYIIVSSGASVSDSALKDRNGAMSDAASTVAGVGDLHLDFYGSNRIAVWVRDHAGMALWVRKRLGKSLSGWQPHGNWSNSPEGGNAHYLTDDHVRIRTDQASDGEGISAAAGINGIRAVLREPRGVVRLVGLSGVGKTRLAEALFDDAVGIRSLAPSTAVYAADAGLASPAPSMLASDLSAAKTRAVIIVDNCSRETHRQLSEVVRRDTSTVSALTVEYDIRDDVPEGTDVFVLEPSSPGLISALVERRYPGMARADVERIAEFAGGNARIAIALADRIDRGVPVASLSDAELFDRLFRQRNDPDKQLLRVAQACSLVYSFEGIRETSEDAELPVLAALTGQTAGDLFEPLAELRKRGLLQQRGPWRAVLPHAIANRLAEAALEALPAGRVLTAFVNDASDRLLLSFSRRLGYLHRSEAAQQIVRSWLGPDGLLGCIAEFDDLKRAMFSNVAPVLPEAALAALERASKEDGSSVLAASQFTILLHRLAFDPALFGRSLSLLVHISRLSGDGGRNNARSASNTVGALFHIVWSGTLAPLEMRLGVAERLLTSGDDHEASIGVSAVRALLETDDFMADHFEFGARTRGHGYWPKNQEEIGAWFSDALSFTGRFALAENDLGVSIRTVLAEAFQGLWLHSGRADQLEALVRGIAAKGFWREGWHAVRRTLFYGKSSLSTESLARLEEIEELLRPSHLADRIRGAVRSSNGDAPYLRNSTESDSAEGYAEAAKRTHAEIHQLGCDVANEEQTLRAIIRELTRVPSVDGKTAILAEGIAQCAYDPSLAWSLIVEEFIASDRSNRSLIVGFLQGLQARDSGLASSLLDDALDRADLASVFPVLQAATTIDARGLSRLHHVLETEVAPIGEFRSLAWGGACSDLDGADFHKLVTSIAAKPGGIGIALEIMFTRLHTDSVRKANAPEIIDTGRAILNGLTFERLPRNAARREDYHVARVIRDCLAGDSGRSIARSLARTIRDATEEGLIHSSDCSGTVAALFEVQPSETLEGLFGGGFEARSRSVSLLRDRVLMNRHPAASLEDEALLAWCDVDPTPRYPFAAAIGYILKQVKDDGPYEWTPIARKLLTAAPHPEAVLREFVHRVRPMAWSGSRADELERRLGLLEKLDIAGLPMPSNALEQVKQELRSEIEKERASEAARHRRGAERFE